MASSKTVRARYLGGMTLDVILPDGTQLTVEPRHIYEVPEAMVKDHPEWKVQDDPEPEPEPERRVHTQDRPAPKTEAAGAERATDSAPREEG